MRRAAGDHRDRRAFTLIEVSLAMVLSGLVLAGCLSIMVAVRNAERVFAARYERTNELGVAHTALTRAMLSLHMQETTGGTVVRAGATEATAVIDEDEEPHRPRLILQTDPTIEPDETGWIPQRLEVVCSTPPVPAGLASEALEWYTMLAKEESLDFSALDGSQGVTRGVFELRPAGQRELLMLRLGLIGDESPMITALDRSVREGQPPAPGVADWTLWWRPILTEEAQQLLDGYGPLSDTEGDEEQIRARLAGAVPLLRHIERCVWELFKEDQFITEHEATEMDELPAYARFEVILTNQQYASWMFEIDWMLGDDPLDIATGTAGDDTSGGEGSGFTNTNNGGVPGNNSGNTNNGGGDRPGGSGRPGGAGSTGGGSLGNN